MELHLAVRRLRERGPSRTRGRLAPCALPRPVPLSLPRVLTIGVATVAGTRTTAWARALRLQCGGVEAEGSVDVVDRPTGELLRPASAEVRRGLHPDARHDLAHDDLVERLVRDVVVELEAHLDEHADGTEGAVDDALLFGGLAVGRAAKRAEAFDRTECRDGREQTVPEHVGLVDRTIEPDLGRDLPEGEGRTAGVLVFHESTLPASSALLCLSPYASLAIVCIPNTQAEQTSYKL